MNVNTNVEALNKNAGKFPASFAIVFALIAALICTAVDFVFTKITIPFGGYIWWALTALAFAGAGFGGGLMTKATKGAAQTAVIIGAVAYGVIGFVLWKFVVGAEMGDVLYEVGISFAIAIAAGWGAAHRGASQRESLAPKPG